MSTAELKNMLKQKIDSVNEDHLLEELLSIIEVEKVSKGAFAIPFEHQDIVKKGLNQIRLGATKSHEEVQSKVKKWLYK